MLPQSRFFGIRRSLYRLAGVGVAEDVRISGSVVVQFRNVNIGAGTWIGRGTSIASTSNAAVTIGARCDISQDVLFIVGSHLIAGPERRAGAGDSRPITVGNGTWIGARVTILGGSSVGSGVVIAAGALIRTDVPDNVLVAGVPARIIRKLD